MIPLTVSPRKISNTLAVVGFILLFPGFIFYHSVVSAFSMPPFLGGLFGVSGGVVLIIFLCLLPFVLPSLILESKHYVLFVLLFFVFIFFWTGIHWVFLTDNYIDESCAQSFKSVALWSAVFFIGVFLPEDSIVTRRVFLLGFIVILLLLIAYVTYSGSIVFVAAQYFDTEGDVATYQGFARSALVVFLYLIADFKKTSSRYLFLVGGLFILFVLAARSEFFAFLFLSVFLVMIDSISNVKYFFIALLGFVSVLVIVAFNYETLSASRQFQVFSLSSDESWMERQDLAQVAIDQIISEPILGNFGGHVSYWGSRGKYAHNLLSAWVNYGSLGFLWFTALSLFAFLDSLFKVLTQGSKDSFWLLSFSMNFVCLLLILVSKSVFWVLPPLAWGFYVRSLAHDYSLKLDQV